MSTYNRVFIVGHPGAGKAFLAKTLATKLQWNFIDADLGLESKFGLPITKIQGKTSKEIARLMNISYRTVEGIMATLMEKLGCNSSKDLIALYHKKI